MNVTVCIPCYNQAEDLHRAMMSALKQTVSPLEVLIIDDGSDIAIQVLDEPDQYPDVEVRVIRVTNRGLPAARNTGLMNARGDAFLPLDADDWIDECYIEKTLPLLQAGADVVLTGLQEHGPTRNGCYQPGYDRPWQEVTAELMLSDYNRFFYCSLLRTSLLRTVGGYNARMSEGLEDFDLSTDLLIRGAKFAAVEEPLFHYTTNPEGMLMRIHRDGGHQRMVEEMRRHHRWQCRVS